MRQRLVVLVLGSVLFVGIHDGRAQTTTTTIQEGVTLRQTFTELTRSAGTQTIGEAWFLGSVLEIGTTPLGVPPLGFARKADPDTGLPEPTLTTFGPAFAESAPTVGAGKVVTGASLLYSTYDRLGDQSIHEMPFAALNTGTATARTGTASLVLSAQTVVVGATIGATDRLDIGVLVPLMRVKLDARSWVEDAAGNLLLVTKGTGVSSGIGDLALRGKFRLVKFGDPAKPLDAGGVSAVVTARLPTGDRDNLRGLGVTRVLGSVVMSTGTGRLKPYFNGGFEWWSAGLDVGTFGGGKVTARHQAQYAAGLEFQAARPLTLLVDVLGRNILGGGRVDTVVDPSPPRSLGILSREAPNAVDTVLTKVAVAPALKWKVKEKVLLTLGALVPVYDNGLHDRFTPTVRLEMGL